MTMTVILILVTNIFCLGASQAGNVWIRVLRNALENKS
jgi:hypothetical protein